MKKSYSSRKTPQPRSPLSNSNPQEAKMTLTRKLRPCQLNFKHYLKNAMDQMAKGEGELQTATVVAEEAAVVEHPGEELTIMAPTLTTYASTAKSQAIFKRSATRASRPEHRKWTPTASPTPTQEMEGDTEGAEAGAAGDANNPWAPQNYDWEFMQEVDFC